MKKQTDVLRWYRAGVVRRVGAPEQGLLKPLRAPPVQAPFWAPALGAGEAPVPRSHCRARDSTCLAVWQQITTGRQAPGGQGRVHHIQVPRTHRRPGQCRDRADREGAGFPTSAVEGAGRGEAGPSDWLTAYTRVHLWSIKDVNPNKKAQKTKNALKLLSGPRRGDAYLFSPPPFTVDPF